MNESDQKFDTCGCCEGVKALTPASLENLPGLSALAYRVGTHSRFKTTMKARLASQTALNALTTRDDDDPAIALLDVWAAVLDVLTFYQERIANEGYLRTATERRSVLELARAIGYELNPGVAASTYLAFTLEDAPGSPGFATIDVGTKAQSLPGPGEQPQIFETIEKIVARAEWNALKPRLTQPQTLLIQGSTLYLSNASTPAKQLYLAGTQANLKAGDLILITTGSSGSMKTLPLRIQRVVVERELERTRVDFALADEPTIPVFKFKPAQLGVITAQRVTFDEDNIKTNILQRRWTQRDLDAFFVKNRWIASEVLDFIATKPAPKLPPPEEGVFAFRERVGFFGNNAPLYTTLRKPQGGYLYPKNWDTAGWEIWKDANTGIYYAPADVYLERSLPGVLKDSWAVFECPIQQYTVYRINAVSETSLAAFGMSGKATGLNLAKTNGDDLTDSDKPSLSFKVRTTSAHVQSERLNLAELPIADIIKENETHLMLDRMVLALQVGQPVALTGEQYNAKGVTRSEIVILHEIIHDSGFTELVFQDGLQYSYIRKTVTLNANVAQATHGETKREVLGSGDASQAFQKFTLKQTPLTFVSAPTSSGAATTLQVRVNDVLWGEVRSLYGLGARERAYITRLTDEGKVTARFGDGKSGARLPTGAENVTATYRVGTGTAGLVKAGQIRLLMTRPLGVNGVVNPTAPAGGADPENRDQARQNAPLTVLTFDRIVSLQDCEDFARAFGGIEKAQAIWLWDGETRLVHITVAGANAAVVAPNSKLYKNLKQAIKTSGDPLQHFRVDSYQPLTFIIEAKVLVAEKYLPEKVLPVVEATLKQAFSFQQRNLGQSVTESEVFAVMQTVEGVKAVDLDKLYLAGQSQILNSRLVANTARWDQGGIKPAELVTLAVNGINLSEMKP